MSECVVRMDEPKSCWGCPCTSLERGILFCVADGDRRKCTMDFRPDWCPIIAVLPDGHGRLVDAEQLRQVLVVYKETDALGHTPLQLCDAMPTIIPATERSEA